jgi:hypothetical protein
MPQINSAANIQGYGVERRPYKGRYQRSLSRDFPGPAALRNCLTRQARPPTWSYPLQLPPDKLPPYTGNLVTLIQQHMSPPLRLPRRKPTPHRATESGSALEDWHNWVVYDEDTGVREFASCELLDSTAVKAPAVSIADVRVCCRICGLW